MSTEAHILAILTARKVFDGRQWRVVDAGGADLVDAAGVLWRGVHGALLWNANLAVVDGGGGAQSDSGRAHRIRVQNQALIAALTAMAAQGAFT